MHRGDLLRGDERRLATLESLGLERIEDASEEQVATVVADCASYFERRPYWKWFGRLDELLRQATGCSYQDKGACHLDLVQVGDGPGMGQYHRRVRDAPAGRPREPYHTERAHRSVPSAPRGEGAQNDASTHLLVAAGRAPNRQGG
jgi:hypothetical protein